MIHKYEFEGKLIVGDQLVEELQAVGIPATRRSPSVIQDKLVLRFERELTTKELETVEQSLVAHTPDPKWSEKLESKAMAELVSTASTRREPWARLANLGVPTLLDWLRDLHAAYIADRSYILGKLSTLGVDVSDAPEPMRAPRTFEEVLSAALVKLNESEVTP